MNKLITHIKHKLELTSKQEAEVKDCFVLKTFRKKELLLQNGIVSKYDFFIVDG